MAWTQLQNGTTATAAQINGNFEHIANWQPRFGASMAVTTGAFSIGSRRHRWGTAYFHSGMGIIDSIRMDVGCVMTNSGEPVRGFANQINNLNVSINYTRFARLASYVIQPTTAGYFTATVASGLDTLLTTTSVRILAVRPFRKRIAESDYVKNSTDIVRWADTSSTQIIVEHDMSTYTSASTQTGFLYYEYGRSDDVPAILVA